MGANQQPQGGNSMAALLGNMSRQPGQQPPGNYGAGLQASTMGGQQPMQGYGGALGGMTQGPASLGGYQPGGQAPIPPGGAGYPQMSPAAQANMMAQLSAMRGQPPQGGQQPMPGQGPGGAQGWATGLQGGIGRPSTGAPGGAPGKGGGNPQLKNAIAGLQGGPPMQQRPGMGPMRRLQGQGMQPPNPAMMGMRR